MIVDVRREEVEARNERRVKQAAGAVRFLAAQARRRLPAAGPLAAASAGFEFGPFYSLGQPCSVHVPGYLQAVPAYCAHLSHDKIDRSAFWRGAPAAEERIGSEPPASMRVSMSSSMVPTKSGSEFIRAEFFERRIRRQSFRMKKFELERGLYEGEKGERKRRDRHSTIYPPSSHRHLVDISHQAFARLKS